MGDFDDCAAFRITEIAKVKARKMIMEKSKFEFSAVLPGAVAETTQDESKIYINEPRLAISMNFWITQIKGKTITALARYKYHRLWFSGRELVFGARGHGSNPGCTDTLYSDQRK